MPDPSFSDFTPEEIELFTAVEKAMSNNAKRLIMLLGFGQTSRQFGDAANMRTVSVILGITPAEVKSALHELFMSGMVGPIEGKDEEV